MVEQIVKQDEGNKKENSSNLPNFKIFDLYDISDISVKDPGLKNAINLEPKLVLKSQGRNVERLGQVNTNIVERLMNKLSTAGHRGKKHKIEKGDSTGKYTKNMNIVLDAFKIIEKRTGKNPVQVLVDAIEKAAPRDGVTIIEYGGARYPQAVDISPLRRVNITLRNIAHGASDKAFDKKKDLAEGLAEEIILASEENGESSAIKKKKESEAQADSAR
ncbi:30S ribosomal protein S7 [Candidatus Pacearchaeota archaeon]|nr:30S ribosomal protein S7 [Candidatus Pacearchaeota archaeon]